MLKAWSGLLALLGTSVLAASCSGAEFGAGGGEPGATGGGDAGGAPTVSGGGTQQSLAGMSSQAGDGSVVIVGGSGNVGGTAAGGAAGEPGVVVECTPDTPLPPEVEGDCEAWVCVDGSLDSLYSPNDLPAVKGMCDVAKCTDAGPKLVDDDNKCAANKRCHQGSCNCRPCPNGSLMNVVADACLMPAGVVASATHSATGSTAAGAIDGTTEKTWNAGTGEPTTLTLDLSSPQTMTALVIYVTGSAGGNAGAKTISVTATVEMEMGAPNVVKTGSWDYSNMATGPIRLELGLVTPKKITLKFSSPTSWVAVNEVFFVLCTP